jgi:hypothetical protein
MKKNRILFLLLLIGISVSAFAKKVEIADARLIAKNTYFEQVNRHAAVSYEAISISSEYVEKYNNHDVYYIFNINDKGFVIISADDVCYPVIGFSFESSYSPSDQSEGFVFWMNGRKKEIAYNIENNIQADANITAMWQHLNVKNFSRSPNTPDAPLDVTPLITSLWDQIFPYNDFVPFDSTCSAYNNHVTTGCVATAMAQIMYYWRWPLQGVGSHCDYSNKYGNLCADFDTTHYDWDGMVDQPSSECNPVSLLMLHAGISVNMDYNSDNQCSSGAYTYMVATALTTYFKYSNSVNYGQKSNYSDASWNSILQGDLNIGEPIQYGGSGPEGGHSWVCDGYQATDFYHFNWGWSGADDGYYYLNNLDPGGYTFNSNQEAVFHITPDPSQGYPPYCSGQTILTQDDFGTIEDGSGPVLNYQNNSNCSWLIEPNDSVSHITLGFEKFRTNPADVVTVYNGPTTSSPVLGTFSGPTMPTGTVTSGPQMLVTFVSTNAATDSGFLLNYNATPIPFCGSSTTLTAYSGSFSDGSGQYLYRNSTSCRWMIMPPNTPSITINFENFNTEPVNDKVQVYNIATNPPVLMETLSGNLGTPNPITINSDKAMVNFSTNKTIRESGWDATYTTPLESVQNLKAFDNLYIYPNPTDGMLNIQFMMNETEPVKLIILSINGEIMYSQDFGIIKGYFTRQVDISTLAKGIYILRLVSDSGIMNEKIVLK